MGGTTSTLPDRDLWLKVDLQSLLEEEYIERLYSTLKPAPSKEPSAESESSSEKLLRLCTKNSRSQHWFIESLKREIRKECDFNRAFPIHHKRFSVLSAAFQSMKSFKKSVFSCIAFYVDSVACIEDCNL
jgi:hypothetical protein